MIVYCLVQSLRLHCQRGAILQRHPVEFAAAIHQDAGSALIQAS